MLTSVLSVVALFAIIGIAAGASGGSGVSTTPAGNVASTVPDGTASARAAASPAATHKAAVARVGSYFDIPGEDGGTYRVTLDKIIDPATAADEFSLPDNGNRYAAALFSVKALSGSLSTEDANDDAEVIGDDGQSYNPSFSDIAGYTNFDEGVIHVAQGDTVKGIVNFEIPAEVKVAKVQWSSGGFGATVQWVVGGS